ADDRRPAPDALARRRRLRQDAASLAARQRDQPSSSTTAAGSSHHGFAPASTRSQVSNSATPTPAATRQSSPTMKFHQKRPNALTWLTTRLPAGRAGR